VEIEGQASRQPREKRNDPVNGVKGGKPDERKPADQRRYSKEREKKGERRRVLIGV